MSTVKRRVRMEMTEVYVFDVDVDPESSPADQGTDAIIALDEMDADDTAYAYEERSFKIEDFETGEPIPYHESEV